MPEERALGQPGPCRDLGDGGVLEAPLAVQIEGGLLEPTPRIRLPPTHGAILRDGSNWHRLVQ
jgi:hypothetical protein